MPNSSFARRRSEYISLEGRETAGVCCWQSTLDEIVEDMALELMRERTPSVDDVVVLHELLDRRIGGTVGNGPVEVGRLHVPLFASVDSCNRGSEVTWDSVLVSLAR